MFLSLFFCCCLWSILRFLLHVEVLFFSCFTAACLSVWDVTPCFLLGLVTECEVSFLLLWLTAWSMEALTLKPKAVFLRCFHTSRLCSVWFAARCSFITLRQLIENDACCSKCQMSHYFTVAPSCCLCASTLNLIQTFHSSMLKWNEQGRSENIIIKSLLSSELCSRGHAAVLRL